MIHIESMAKISFFCHRNGFIENFVEKNRRNAQKYHFYDRFSGFAYIFAGSASLRGAARHGDGPVWQGNYLLEFVNFSTIEHVLTETCTSK